MSDDNLNRSDELSIVDDAEEEELAVVDDQGEDVLEEVEEPAAEHAAGDDEEVEYEYVYEDEHGNPIEAPSGDLDPSHFEEEVIQVIDENGTSADPSAVTVNIPPENQETRRVRTGSTRRLSDRRGSRRNKRQSGRLSSRQMDPSQMKYAKLKTLLMVGSLALIPILIIAIILTYCYKRGYWPFRRNMTKTVVVQNNYERGRDLAGKAWRAFKGAKQRLQGQDDKYYSVLEQCEQNYATAIKLMQEWRDRHKDKGYWYVDQHIQDANIKLREIREQKFKIEMRRSMKN